VVRRTAPIRVISFVLLAACGALCQKLPSPDRRQGFQFDSSNSPELQRQEMLAAGSLPDAPSTVQPPTVPTIAVLGMGVGTMRGTQLGRLVAGPQPGLNAPYQVALGQRESSTFLGKYLSPQLLSQDPRYHASTSDSFMGRASYAASRIFVTRDDSGKTRVNTRYFLGVMSSVAMHAAYRPYRTRSGSETFNNFGSTIGGDAGINVFHEFRPGIQQMMKGLTPKFLSRIEGRITHNQIPR
jgi:hypothetical protein